MASPAMTQPSPPASALATKIARRPWRRIRAPAGTTLAANPRTSADTGSVARPGAGASSEPMVPPSNTNRKLPDMHSAWVADSIQT